MTLADLKTFVWLGSHTWAMTDAELDRYAFEIERRYGEKMFNSMLVWLHDPEGRESPLATYFRFRDFLVNPASKERRVL